MGENKTGRQQKADPDTADFITFLSRRPLQRSPVLLLGFLKKLWSNSPVLLPLKSRGCLISLNLLLSSVNIQLNCVNYR